jgi:hypothetical protein
MRSKWPAAALDVQNRGREGGADRRKGITLTSGPNRSVAEERGGGADGCWAVMGRVKGVGPQRARERNEAGG